MIVGLVVPTSIAICLPYFSDKSQNSRAKFPHLLSQVALGYPRPTNTCSGWLMLQLDTSLFLNKLDPLIQCSDFLMLQLDSSLFLSAAKRAFQVRVQKSNVPFSYTRLLWSAWCSCRSWCLHNAVQTTIRSSLATFNSSSLIPWPSYFHFKDSIITAF